MAQYDTRALVRSVVPLILSEGRNPTKDTVKAKIRETHPALGDINPSDSTVNDELSKIRVELGKQLTSSVALPGLPEALSAMGAELLMRLMDVARAEADKAISSERSVLAEMSTQAQAAISESARLRAVAEAELERQSRRFETVETRLTAELAGERERAAELAARHSDTTAALARAEQSVRDLGAQIARLTAEKHAAEQRRDEQLRLAEERYRDLEKAKLLELDSARIQRDKALEDLATANAALTEKNAALQDAFAQLAEQSGVISTLRERLQKAESDCVESRSEAHRLIGENAARGERLAVAEQRLAALADPDRILAWISNPSRASAASVFGHAADLSIAEAFERELDPTKAIKRSRRKSKEP